MFKLLLPLLMLFSLNAYALTGENKTLTINQLWSNDGLYSSSGSVASIVPVQGVVSTASATPTDVNSILSIPKYNFSGMSDTTIKNQYSTSAGRFFDQIFSSVVEMMHKNSTQTATVNFEQQFMTGTVYKRVINTTLLKLGGNGSVQVTRLGSTIIRDPIILKASYISKKVSSGVPPEFAYANAGRITYRLFDKDNNPLTPEQVVDVNGAYDQINPETDLNPTDRLFNTAWMPECLMSREWADYVHTRDGVTLDGTNAFLCPTAAQGASVDLKQLADQYDATDIVLDYGQRLDVVYQEDGSAKILVDVTSRVLTNKKYLFFIAKYGKPTFTVTGSIAFELMSDVVQYHAKTDDIYVLRNDGVAYGAGIGVTITGNQVNPIASPTRPFSKTIELVDNGSRAFYQNTMINPFTTNNPATELLMYDYRNDTVNGLGVDKYCYAGQCSRIAPITGGID